jgi:soluble P-type ATPase
MTLAFSIPGRGHFEITNVLFDLNGTLACEGIIAQSTQARLVTLSAIVTLYVMSADTHGTLDQVSAGLPLQVQRMSPGIGAPQKQMFVETLGTQHTIAVGNGRNDAAMLKAAALGIVILGPEGVAPEALLAADVLFGHINDALDSLVNPTRLVATLRQ